MWSKRNSTAKDRKEEERQVREKFFFFQSLAKGNVPRGRRNYGAEDGHGCSHFSLRVPVPFFALLLLPSSNPLLLFISSEDMLTLAGERTEKHTGSMLSLFSLVLPPPLFRTLS